MNFKNKNIVSFIALLLFFQTTAFAGNRNDEITKQIIKNAHVDWSIYKTNDYRWRNFGIGSGYTGNFEWEKNLSWKVGLNLNWSKYSLYNPSAYSLLIRETNMYLTTITVPAVVEYNVYKNFVTDVNVYTGPVLEQVLFTTSNDISAKEIEHLQFGWSIGTRLRFLAIFSLRISYDHYFTGLFTTGDLNRSAIHFALGF